MTIYSSTYSQSISIDGMYLNAPYGLFRSSSNKFSTNGMSVSITPLNGGNSSHIRTILQTTVIQGYNLGGISEGLSNGSEQIVVSHYGYGSNSNIFVLASLVYTRGKLYSIISTVDESIIRNEDLAVEKAYDNLDFIWRQLKNFDF